jgi:cytochrome c oxidase assembly protein subunit 15
MGHSTPMAEQGDELENRRGSEPGIRLPATGVTDATRVARARRLVRNLALTGAVLTLSVLVLAAAMRFQAAGVGCEPWPECYGSDAARAIRTPAWARLAHRISAMAVSVCALMIAMICFRTRADPRLPRARAALVIIGVAILAGLGRFSGPNATASVALANLLLGLALAAMLASLAVTPRTRGAPTPAVDWVTAIVLAITTVLGGIASTHRLAGNCADFLACSALADASPAAMWIAGGHRALGVLAVLWTCAWAIWSYRAGARGAWAMLLVGASLALIAFGAAQASGIGALSVALMHHAASGIALVAAVACTDREDRRARTTGAESSSDTNHTGRRSP